MILDELVSILGLEIRDTGIAQFRSNISSTIGKVALATVGVTSLAGAITGLMAQAGDTAANARFARAVNISSQELQRFEFAAKRMGIASGALRGFLSDVTTQLAQFRTGGADKLFESFAQIGVNPLANGKPKEALELLLELADAAGNASTQMQALGVAGQIGLGAEWFPFLKLGREGIMGLAGEADVLSDSAIRAAENFDRSMQRFKNVGSTFVAEEGAPILDQATKGLEALIAYSRSEGFASLKKDINEVADGLFRALQNVIAFYRELEKELPEGSTTAALLAGLGLIVAKKHPVIATATAVGVAGSDAQRAFKGEEGTVTANILPTLAALLDQASDFYDRRVLNPINGRDLAPLDLEGRVSRFQESIGMSPKTVIESLTVNVGTTREANDIINNADEKLRDAAERGTGAAR